MPQAMRATPGGHAQPGVSLSIELAGMLLQNRKQT
jgi:hypothetical protein